MLYVVQKNAPKNDILKCGEIWLKVAQCGGKKIIFKHHRVNKRQEAVLFQMENFHIAVRLRSYEHKCKFQKIYSSGYSQVVVVVNMLR